MVAPGAKVASCCQSNAGSEMKNASVLRKMVFCTASGRVLWMKSFMRPAVGASEWNEF